MVFVCTEGKDNERKFAHLTEVDRWDDAGAQTLSHQVKRGERRGKSTDHHESCEEQRPSDQNRSGKRDLHPEPDEEKCHEEIAQACYFGSHIERVREGRERYTGD